MPETLKTKDYSIFKKHESNRPIDPNNLKKIKFSLQSNNLMELKPILVDAEMRVIDGQHRLKACEALGLEVFYQVSKTATHADIISICAAQKNWSTDDYINYYSSLGNEDYLKISLFCKKRNITASELLGYFGHFFSFQRSGKKFSSLKLGKIEFPNDSQLMEIDSQLQKLRDILCLIDRYHISKKKLSQSRLLRNAVLSIINKPEVDFQMLMDKITRKAEALRPCTSTGAYYVLLRDIYNWKNQNPID